jgi:type II secretory pathway component PulF
LLLYPVVVGCAALVAFIVSGSMLANASGPFAGPPLAFVLLAMLATGTAFLVWVLLTHQRHAAWLYRLPIVGRALQAADAATMIRALALLTEANLPPQQALQLAAEACASPLLRQQGLAAARQLAAGEPFVRAVESMQALSTDARWMLASAWQQERGFPTTVGVLANELELGAADRAQQAAMTIELLVIALAGLAVMLYACGTYMRLASIVDHLVEGL